VLRKIATLLRGAMCSGASQNSSDADCLSNAPARRSNASQLLANLRRVAAVTGPRKWTETLPGRHVPHDSCHRRRRQERFSERIIRCQRIRELPDCGTAKLAVAFRQVPAYTAAQLDAFRTGERKNDGDGIMQAIAKRSSDADVKALGEYYGTMP
jgi:hypothetical protein